LACDDLLAARGVANPLANLRKQKVRSSDVIEKQDLSDEELRKLFQGPVHVGRARPAGGAGEAAFWLPILGFTTGARMRELAQLSVHEVVLRDGVTCLWLTNREDDEQNIEHLTEDERERLFKKSLKTGDSRRIVPVHSTVLALGFMDYVQTLREARSPALFPDLRVDCHGNVAGNFSKWFNLYLNRVGIKIRGLDWISFRHTLKTAMREAHIPQDVADYLTGHSAGRVAQSYGRFPPKTMREHIEKLTFPALLEIPQWVSRPFLRPGKP
jgi:integrase